MKTNYIFLGALVSLLVLFISGCSSEAKPAPSSPAGTNMATPLSAVLLPDTGASRVSEFRSKGNLNLAGATFLAAGKLEVNSPAKNLYQFTATFPANTIANITIKLTPNKKYLPTADERAMTGEQAYNAKLTHAATGKTYNMKLQYFLPQGTLPAAFKGGPKIAALPLVLQAVKAFQGQLAVYGSANADYGSGRLEQGSGDLSGVMVELTAVLIEGGKQLAGTVEEFLFNMGLKDVGSPIGTTWDSALNVVEALNMSSEYQDMVAELDELQAEAENPTNPLTQKAYAEDPNAKQQILDEIADARSELKWDTLVDYLNTEISVGLGLLGSPALSLAAAPITTWNSDTIKQLMHERIKIIRKMITTGVFKVDRSSNSGGTDSSGNNGYTDGSGATPLPPGTWMASYESSIQEESDTDKTFYTDKGSFAFKVGPDFQITGTGRGNIALQILTDHGTTDGQATYSYSVSGVAMLGRILELHFTRPAETIKGSSTINDRHEPEPYETSIPGPMVPKGSMLLESGETLKEALDETRPDGVRSIQSRTLTIN